MSPSTRPSPLAAVALAAATLLLATPTTAYAAGPTPSTPPGGTTTSPAPTISPTAPNLKLGDGATLAPSRIIDIKSVVEDLGGEERRSDTPSDTTFALQAEVLFSKNSAKLNPLAASRIKAIATEIGAQHATNVRVFGFTDDLGSYEHGKVLSKQRADAVQQELAKSLPSSSAITFLIRGYSEDYPIASNATEEGRTKNRRVEVSFPRTAT
ncbi:OmpA family protein [Streptomyces sp. NPDC050738]|uniref:OmpA family protein n=1 Tax=Streptomyces sp. NPDC050738 TaxID=3154744 RepID=UPI003420E860